MALKEPAGAFTVSVPSDAHVRESDHVGIVSGRDADKFETTGLTAVASEKVDAPYVGEAPFVLECRVKQVVEIGLHTQFIGEIVDVKADEEILGDNGLPDVEKVRPFFYSSGNKAYYGTGGFLGDAFTNRSLGA